MEDLVDNNPEKISPNVVLRPMYQQRILPNLAYIGGPGELAYWLEYKKMFDGHKIVFPILTPRNFVTIIDKQTKTKIEKLNFKPEDFFKSEQQLVNEFQQRTGAVIDLHPEKEKLSEVYTQIIKKIEDTDKSLGSAASAEFQKAFKGIDIVESKAIKALKQRSETEINQIKAIKQKLFPENLPQERHENFSAFYLKQGASFLKELKEKIDPFKLKHLILSEQTPN